MRSSRKKRARSNAQANKHSKKQNDAREDPADIFKYITATETKWFLIIGCPETTRIWQVGDSSQCNGILRKEGNKQKIVIVQYRTRYNLGKNIKASGTSEAPIQHYNNQSFDQQGLQPPQIITAPPRHLLPPMWNGGQYYFADMPVQVHPPTCNLGLSQFLMPPQQQQQYHVTGLLSTGQGRTQNAGDAGEVVGTI